MKNKDTLSQPSIFILRLSAIGDVCHTIATVQQIQNQFPQSKMTWLIGKVEYALVSHLPNIEFILFDKSNGIKEYLKLKQTLKNRRFDVLLHMQVSLRASLASLLVRAKIRWGFDKARAKDLQWLFTNHRIENKANAHVAEGLMQFAQAIGTSPLETVTWEFSPPQIARDWLANIQAINKKYIVISPSASHPNRNWLSLSYVKIADYLSNLGYQVVITGSLNPKEIALAKTICSKSKFPLIDLSGQTTLPQLCALIEGAELLISPDSGPAHISTLVKTKVVGLYAVSNPERTGPYHARHLCVSVYQQLIEQKFNTPLEKIKWGTRLKGNDLMANITVDRVIASIDQHLSI